jgi:hypothetical protein
MEEAVLCDMALKCSNGRQTHHTKAGLPVCREQALKGVGERNTHGGCRCGLRGGPPGTRPRERSNTSGWREEEEALRGIDGGNLAFGCAALCCAGKLLTGNTGSLCEQQPLKALCAPCGPIPQYKILYYPVASGHPPPPLHTSDIQLGWAAALSLHSRCFSWLEGSGDQWAAVVTSGDAFRNSVCTSSFRRSPKGVRKTREERRDPPPAAPRKRPCRHQLDCRTPHAKVDTTHHELRSLADCSVLWARSP